MMERYPVSWGDSVKDLGDGVGNAVDDIGNAVGNAVEGR